MKNSFIIIFLVLIATLNSFAQDPQLSQYYNAPLYLNPAFAGTGNNTRAVFNYRNQWPSLGNSFSTFAASLDHNIESINGGIGLLVKRDQQGVGKLSSTDIGAMFSYQIELNEKWSFRPAIQTSFVIRSVDYSKFVFGDQLSNNGPTGSGTADDIVGAGPNTYPDISSGGLWFTDLFWIGLAVNHMNRPSQSFQNGTHSPLPIKYSVQSGLKIPIMQDKRDGKYASTQTGPERSITPTFNYKQQGKFNQLDLGLYLTYDPIMFGVWYRGIPVKHYENYTNNEAIILMTGLHIKTFTLGYSYDITMSSLQLANSGGAHELSLIYEWEVPYRKKKPCKRSLPCPKFYNRTKIL